MTVSAMAQRGLRDRWLWFGGGLRSKQCDVGLRLAPARAEFQAADEGSPIDADRIALAAQLEYGAMGQGREVSCFLGQARASRAGGPAGHHARTTRAGRRVPVVKSPAHGGLGAARAQRRLSRGSR